MIEGSGVRFPAAPVMCRSLGQAMNPHCLWSPIRNGYLVERIIEIVRMASTAENALHSLQREMRPRKSEFLYQGRYHVKSVEHA